MPGSIRLGETVKLAYVDQSRDVLNPDKTVWQEISDGLDTIQLGSRQVNSRAYVARFNFSGSDQQKKVGSLSGGERNRVHLAKMLKQGANVLLLDEPTNDLDVNTLRALEEAVENFAGCAVIISHDRWFLDRVATHILAFEGESRVVWFEGNYSDYEADRRARLGAAADQPHRIKYRHLTRRSDRSFFTSGKEFLPDLHALRRMLTSVFVDSSSRRRGIEIAQAYRNRGGSNRAKDHATTATCL